MVIKVTVSCALFLLCLQCVCINVKGLIPRDTPFSLQAEPPSAFYPLSTFLHTCDKEKQNQRTQKIHLQNLQSFEQSNEFISTTNPETSKHFQRLANDFFFENHPTSSNKDFGRHTINHYKNDGLFTSTGQSCPHITSKLHQESLPTALKLVVPKTLLCRQRLNLIRQQMSTLLPLCSNRVDTRRTEPHCSEVLIDDRGSADAKLKFSTQLIDDNLSPSKSSPVLSERLKPELKRSVDKLVVFFQSPSHGQ